MPSVGPDHVDQIPDLAQRLDAVWQPRYAVLEQWKRTCVPLSDARFPPDAIAIPDDIDGLGRKAAKLVPEDEAAALFTKIVRRTEDIIYARIPAYAVEDVTTCIFPKEVVEKWPRIVYFQLDGNDPHCLRVKDVRGKGKGCVASQAVSRGDLVAKERALFMMPRTCLSPRQFINCATAIMPQNEYKAFYALHNCKSTDPDDVMSIVATNSFYIPGVPGHNVLYAAVFETFSRINHRCVTPRLSPAPR